MAISEYVCRDCRHEFPWFSVDGPHAICPRCGGTDLKLNPWLLLTSEADGVTDEDHLESLLAV